jgi:hypothetical protein
MGMLARGMLVVVYREVVDAACGWAVYGGVVSVMVVSM